MTTMTYGTMPSRELFGAKYKTMAEGFPPERGFRFRNDKRVGTGELSEDELWEELQRAWREYEELGDGDAGDWCSAVLGCLDIEWV